MGQELVIPDSFKTSVPAKAFAMLNPNDDSLAEGIGQSYAVIGYKGKVWSLRTRGERHNFIRPDDGTPLSYIDVVILGQAKQKSKSFYKKYDPGTSDGERPICSSIDGIVPDIDVMQKQCDTCALCPRNAWKIDPGTGRKGRECTDYKRLAVLVLPTLTKPILGEPLMEPCFLRVPPASLNSLAIMGETMASQGFHYATYITRISFDPNEAHPKMIFRPLQGLTDAEAPVILELIKDPTVGRITGGDIALGQAPTPSLAPAGTASTGISTQGTPAPATSVNAAVHSPSVIEASAQPVTQTGGAQAKTDANPAPSLTTSAAVDTGFGAAANQTAALAPSSPAVQPTTQASAPVSDTGAPEEADSELDARIASLIKTS